MMTKPGLKVVTTVGGGATHFWAYKNEDERKKSIEQMMGREHIVEVALCDIRSLEWTTPNHQCIQTGLKVFDEQFQGIPGGNLIANTFLGQHIRPRNEVECNGHTFKPGDLQNFDLKTFVQVDRQQHLTQIVRKCQRLESESGWLTAVFHWTGPSYRRSCVLHGAVLTDRHLNLIRRINRWDLGLQRRSSSMRVMDVVTPFLTQEMASNIQVLKH